MYIYARGAVPPAVFRALSTAGISRFFIAQLLFWFSFAAEEAQNYIERYRHEKEILQKSVVGWMGCELVCRGVYLLPGGRECGCCALKRCSPFRGIIYIQILFRCGRAFM